MAGSSKKYKVIIFDMGGVIVDLDLERCKRFFREKMGFMQIDEILDACNQKGIFGMLEGGEIDEQTFTAKVLADSKPGCTASMLDEAMENFLMGIEPYKIEVLKELKQQYPLYMLSNNNPISMRRSHAVFEQAGLPMEEAFRKMFVSCEMCKMKPKAPIYQQTIAEICELEGNGITAADMIFIDDSKVNVQGAIDAGLPAVWYDPSTDLRDLLKRIL